MDSFLLQLLIHEIKNYNKTKTQRRLKIINNYKTYTLWFSQNWCIEKFNYNYFLLICIEKAINKLACNSRNVKCTIAFSLSDLVNWVQLIYRWFGFFCNTITTSGIFFQNWLYCISLYCGQSFISSPYILLVRTSLFYVQKNNITN